MTPFAALALVCTLLLLSLVAVIVGTTRTITRAGTCQCGHARSFHEQGRDLCHGLRQGAVDEWERAGYRYWGEGDQAANRCGCQVYIDDPAAEQERVEARYRALTALPAQPPPAADRRSR